MQQLLPEDAVEPMELVEEEERRLMREAMQHRLKDGETWYIVARGWFLKWKSYVNYDIAYTYDTATRPGRIPNEDLLESADGKQKLKKYLQEGVDFELVPEKAWQLLEGWYGGEPIPRFVIKTGSSLAVEVGDSGICNRVGTCKHV
jgi:ubiquitin carboxyl-terminal hydrolase 4/11/15